VVKTGIGEEAANLYGTLTITQYEAMVGARKLITVPRGLQNRLYNVVVPQGIGDGQVLRLKNVGKTKPDGTRGDIMLRVRVQHI
jgi:DnaJ-class molecular chaperone